MLLFAKLRDIAGADRVDVELPAGATVANLRRALTTSYPDLASLLERCAIAVNHDFAVDDTVLGDRDEIAVIPPVSGG
ncbi:Molybdenum cofactor biosynthesis protein MoaD / Molybdenum cofactor biosynthesis protein MoaE [Fimbriiglobus ruber]|uniref:Molybdopterin synthase sulfur carrier subunit n=1 Tax=Fimbriiglobus ruber TaxID=1908690 RepID=A0A225DVT4_9BACT|nr:Molybdenum cofactor biosynthesis protein MoaD / Molybdenum cofactor biosynthesis protein MoaE [Fimbriiglobus ruber]